MVRRGDPIPSMPASGPIYVCTRNNVLADVIEATPAARRADLVLMQNGMLGAFLEEQGLPDASQVLLYLAVAKLGEKPTDGITGAPYRRAAPCPRRRPCARPPATHRRRLTHCAQTLIRRG